MKAFPHPEPLSLADLPLRTMADWPIGTTLVVAPHPDDETLGCGGAIALLRQRQQPVQVLVMSDGTGSHPHSRQYPAPALRTLREAETRTALQILGVDPQAIAFFRLPDKAVPAVGSPDFAAAVARTQAYLLQLQPRTLLLPWREDPHRDHRATWQILHHSLRQADLSPRCWEYPIWEWDRARAAKLRSSPTLRLWRLDIQAVGAMKQRAIAAYRSQISDLIQDDPSGFRLSPSMLANFTRPWELYIEVYHG